MLGKRWITLQFEAFPSFIYHFVPEFQLEILFICRFQGFSFNRYIRNQNCRNTTPTQRICIQLSCELIFFNFFRFFTTIWICDLQYDVTKNNGFIKALCDIRKINPFHTWPCKALRWFNYQWLYTKMRACPLQSVLSDFEDAFNHAPSDEDQREIMLVCDSIRLGGAVLGNQYNLNY